MLLEDAEIVIDVWVIIDETEFIVIVIVVGDCEGLVLMLSIDFWLILFVEEAWMMSVVIMLAFDEIIVDSMIGDDEWMYVDKVDWSWRSIEETDIVVVVGMILENVAVNKEFEDGIVRIVVDDEVWITSLVEDIDDEISCMMVDGDCSIIVVDISIKLEDPIDIKIVDSNKLEDDEDDSEDDGDINVEDEGDMKLDDDEAGGSGIGGQRSLVDS